MNLPTPRLEIYPERIEENARAITSLCHTHHIQLAGVTKVVMAQPEVVQALINGGVDLLADSRLENLKSIRDMGVELPLMLLRIPAPSQAEEVVARSDISLNSSFETIQRLAQAAESQGKVHQVILMVDLGDLREGTWPDHASGILQKAITLPNIQISGLGANLACFGGVIPTTEKMQALIDLRDQCQREMGIDLPVLSGGNSANLPLLLAGGMPDGINQLRIGETIQLGRNVIDRSPFPGTRQDTYRIAAEIIELERKPSVPIGQIGQDAFGGTPQFTNRGIRRRAICNLGRQDVVIDNLEPEDQNLIVLGGSSDHLIVDVEDSHRELKVGSEIAFLPGYGALLAASTSPYVKKTVMPGYTSGH